MSYLSARDSYAAHVARQWLGSQGQCLGSMSFYRSRYPDHEVGKNQVLVVGGHMVWCGDFDYTLCESALAQVAAILGCELEIYPEGWYMDPVSIEPVRRYGQPCSAERMSFLLADYPRPRPRPRPAMVTRCAADDPGEELH